MCNQGYTIVTENKDLEGNMMLSITIHVLEVLALGMLGYVGARSYSLAQKQAQSPQLQGASNSDEPQNAYDHEIIIVEEDKNQSTYNTRITALKEAQIFSGIQMIPIKREFTDLFSPQLVWLRDAVSLYLIGASDYIAKEANCDLKTRNKFNSLVLSSTLKLSESELNQAVKKAADREQGSDEEQMIIAGAKAAKQWKETQKVSAELKLRTRLNDWGVFT